MSRILSKEEWIRKRRRRKKLMMLIAFLLMLSILIIAALIIGKLVFRSSDTPKNDMETIEETYLNGIRIKKQFLTPNEYSRPQTKLTKVQGIVIHYTANPGTSAKGNRSYFEGLATKHTTKASSHYIIGLEGEIIQCIPLTEIAYASNNRNDDTISIECCHPDETGEFNEETYQSLVGLSAALCRKFNLEEEDIIRHYDVTGKACPLYYVEHEDAWLKLKENIMEEVEAPMVR